MFRQRFTKIVATLGPATSSPERLKELFEAGADVFRLNFSHGTHDDHKQRVEQLRALEKQYKHPIAILMDLQGPKLRLGAIGEGPDRAEEGPESQARHGQGAGHRQARAAAASRDLPGGQARRRCC